MVANIKFSLIIVVSFIIFRDPIKIEQIVAILLVMIGEFLSNYCIDVSYFCLIKKFYFLKAFSAIRFSDLKKLVM